MGGLRTALFNYLFARRHGGAFLLRIEDTDEERRVEGSVESLLSTLQWCGLRHDEGPGVPGGSAGPYIQSQRLPLYAEHAQRLLEGGHAYRCFCTAERLGKLREYQASKGLAPGYDGACRGIEPSASRARAAAGEACVVRLAVPLGASTALEDLVLGEVRFSHTAVDDQVLLKSSGWPTYHLACVVDDHLMGVSHVIRGQEWLPSTPKHLLLYKALGWKPPAFAHLPLLLNADKTKLSKRKGDAAVEDYAGAGFLPGALVNFVATLGWTPREALSPTATLEDLARAFSLKDVHKANAVVDRHRLEWTNAQHVKAALAGGAAGAEAGAAAPLQQQRQSNAEETRRLIREGAVAAVLPALVALVGEEGAREALGACSFEAVLVAQHERVGALSDFGPLLLPFLLRVAPQGVAGEEAFKRYLASEAPASALKRIASSMGASGAGEGAGTTGAGSSAGSEFCALEPRSVLHPALRELLSDWTALAAGQGEAAASGDRAWGDKATRAVKAAAKRAGLPAGKLMLPLRWALTGLDAGTAFSDTLGLLGGAECCARLKVSLGL